MTSRFLKLRNPKLKILILEKNKKTNWSPGESTVGIAGLFLIRDLGLSTYCYVNHLPKNGLRYFFHEPHEKFNIEDFSEIGSNILPIFPTFQLDRKRLDCDLRELNLDLGIDLRVGAEVTDIKLGEHKVTYLKEGRKVSVGAKWLINSSGRNTNFNKDLKEFNPITASETHKTAAAWGRYTNVTDIDSLGTKEWRKRAGHTSRYLSTNHFMGDGYWIWAIPIGEDVVSFGAVYDKDIIQDDLLKQDKLNLFLNNHPFCGRLLKGATQLDFQSAPHLAYQREFFCHEDKVIYLAESYGFTDPFYSPGSDTIARQAYLVEHLINSPNEELNNRVELINNYTKYEQEIILSLYEGQYGGFGSDELFNIKSFFSEN